MQEVRIHDCGDGVCRADGVQCGYGPVSTLTANYAIYQTDAGKTFDNMGATGTVVFTLPAPKAGLMFKFQVKTPGQVIEVTAPTAGTMKGPATPYSGVNISSAGANQFAHLELFSDVTNWYVSKAVGTWTIS